jgi:ABC-2 type transport system permease protein
LRSLVDGTGTDWVQLGIAAVGAVVLLLLSMWYLVAMLRTFRKRGYITRYT